MTEDFCVVTDDEETSCQSNCKQPGSGASDSNVRSKVIGYYEAWVHSRKCNGMVSVICPSNNTALLPIHAS